MINLYRSVKTSKLTQEFGENLAYAKVDSLGNAIRPYEIIGVNKNDYQPKGYLPFYYLLGMRGHNGRDWVAYHGEPVYFPVTSSELTPIQGTCWTEVDKSGGKGVSVIYQDPDTKEWSKILFWHLKDFNVYDGQVIKSGDLIGWADSTGASAGDHLHEAIKPLNSRELEDKKFFNNGYTGAINPLTEPSIRDFQESTFILEALNLKQQLTLAQQIFKLLLIFKGR